MIFFKWLADWFSRLHSGVDHTVEVKYVCYLLGILGSLFWLTRILSMNQWIPTEHWVTAYQAFLLAICAGIGVQAYQSRQKPPED